MDRARIGSYLLGEHLGGSRAAVHRATDVTSGRTVVVKTASWDRPAVTAALGREAAILRRVSHPSLVALIDVVEDVDGRTLVLANGAEGDLTRLLARDGAMDPAHAADLGARIAGALGVLHERAILHRDVRPSNVVVDAELVPVLCDLDHAFDPSQPRLASDSEVVGDRAHVDPRLLDGMPQGPAMDLYGLGSVVWAAATGGRARPEDLWSAAGEMPPGLLAAIDACLTDSVGDAAAAAASFAAAAGEARTWRPSLLAPTPTGVTGVRRWPPPTPSSVLRRARREVPPPPGPPPAIPSDHDPAIASGRRVPARASAVAGGGAAGVRPTRRWATPAPARAAAAPVPTTAAGGRRLLIPALAVGAVLAVGAAGVAAWHHLAADDDRPAVATGPPAEDPVTAAQTPRATGDDDRDAEEAVIPPPPCEGIKTSPDRPSETIALADVDGRGCSVVLRYADGALTLPSGRFAVGARGDRLIAGDWDGDGRWSPGLHRPATGEVFLFGDTAAADGSLTSSPPVRIAPDSDVLVIGRDGAHEVVTAPSPARPRR